MEGPQRGPLGLPVSEVLAVSGGHVPGLLTVAAGCVTPGPCSPSLGLRDPSVKRGESQICGRSDLFSQRAPLKLNDSLTQELSPPGGGERQSGEGGSGPGARPVGWGRGGGPAPVPLTAGGPSPLWARCKRPPTGLRGTDQLNHVITDLLKGLRAVLTVVFAIYQVL